MKMFLLVAVLWVGPSHADQRDRFDSIRIGSKLITTDDSSEKLLDVAGQPLSRKELKTERGFVLAELWEYRIGSKRVVFRIAAGKIRRIED